MLWSVRRCCTFQAGLNVFQSLLFFQIVQHEHPNIVHALFGIKCNYLSRGTMELAAAALQDVNTCPKHNVQVEPLLMQYNGLQHGLAHEHKYIGACRTCALLRCLAYHEEHWCCSEVVDNRVFSTPSPRIHQSASLVPVSNQHADMTTEL